ncbi:GntR family transcriptional regulator [Qingshengfaniella alkalisoli]|uniref:GntR family transcriptional regulator n=1 Tax=Qingshengfaniella alkalisoli TaxID=2599296 RepID=A0A5B8IZH2_9RHOB|nr:GntR family transcriptional regulator [Qingshengfaniella alkalisoli]QDY71084.1 GntR family transcriptional regulator [Qingshengfaniella alkalisoli]
MAEPGSKNRAAPSVRQTAYELFQRALLSGRLRPGQMVSQRELVELMNLSVGALRELLPRLESEGLIVVQPQRGILIPAIDLPMIRDTFQMRMALEREAVISAIRDMPDDTLDAQRKLHVGMIERVALAPDPELLREGQEIDSGFHLLLVRNSGNVLLQQAYNLNAIRMRLIKLDRITLTERILPDAFGDHLLVIDAIRARDKQAAIDAMDAHIFNARERALQL